LRRHRKAPHFPAFKFAAGGLYKRPCVWRICVMPTEKGSPPDRTERLAKALRANLARRKAQARARTTDHAGKSEPSDDAKKTQDEEH